ncbi:MAG TPA: zinc-ribbon domain-containing protein [Candidatus Eisenbacteria bacterium]|nr:zinc-ribbon domain-containing protein [Candidatus Eisenbacteria bacterium]
MTVRCPHCSTAYRLPERLMGAGGARIRCPNCAGEFIVSFDNPGPEAAPEPPPAQAPPAPVHEPEPTGAEDAVLAGAAEFDLSASSAPAAAATAEAPPADPAAVAESVLEVFETFMGDALTRSRERGTVLSDHGPAIIAVWEEYRKRAGADAPSTVFRAALRDRTGVDLVGRGAEKNPA